MVWYNVFRKVWRRRYRKKKTEEEIRNSEIYQRLFGQVRELRESVSRYEDRLVKEKLAFAEYEKATDAKLSERNSKISGLEETLGKSAENIKENELLVAQLMEQFLDLEMKEEETNGKVSGLLNSLGLSKTLLKQFRNDREYFKRQRGAIAKRLQREINEREKIIEEKIDEVHADYEKQIDTLAEKMQGLVDGIKKDFGDQAARRNSELAGFFDLFKRDFGFDKIAGIYLDRDGNSIYATPLFYNTFGLSSAIDLTQTSVVAEVISHVKAKRTDTLPIKIKLDKDEVSLNAHFRYSRDKGRAIGVFVEYELPSGFFAKIGNIFTRHSVTNARGKIEKILDYVDETDKPETLTENGKTFKQD